MLGSVASTVGEVHRAVYWLSIMLNAVHSVHLVTRVTLLTTHGLGSSSRAEASSLLAFSAVLHPITVRNSGTAVRVFVIPRQWLGVTQLSVILDTSILGQHSTVGTLADSIARVPLRVRWAFAVSFVVLPPMMRMHWALASSRLDVGN